MAALVKTAAGLKPFEPWALRNLVVLLSRENALSEAKKVVTRWSRIFPLDFEAAGWLDRIEHGRTKDMAGRRFVPDIGFTTKRHIKYRYIFFEDGRAVAAKVNAGFLQMLKAGELSTAAQWLRMFNEIYDQSPTISYNLAQIYGILGLSEKALVSAWRAVEMDSRYMEAIDMIGGLLYRIGDYDGAIEYY